MDMEQQTFSNSLAELLEETKQQKELREPLPQKLHLESIHIVEILFQPRQFLEDSGAASEDHTQKLTTALLEESSNSLDPITVWWSGKKWYVLDGTHRFKAYKRIKQIGKLKTDLVPVEVFSGNLYQALAECARLNAKDKLSMTKSDKLNRAWKLTVLSEHSKSEIHSICKVGTTTVSRMRNVLLRIKNLEPNKHKDEILNMTWESAQQGKKERLEYNDCWEEKIARQWSQRIAKTFGTKAATQPDIFARAIEIYSERLPTDLLSNWIHLANNEEPDF